MSNSQGYPQDLRPEEAWIASAAPQAGANAPKEASEKKEDEYSSPEAMLKSGAILKAYGKTDMLSVSPIPAIHKVRCSIVKLGTGGKEHLDFYMGVDDMRRLCAEILTGAFARRIAADKSTYPSAYKFVGGQDGCRELNIGQGKKGILVQVREKKNDQWASRVLPVSFSSLQDMAFYYNLVMGITPAAYYYGHLAKVFWEGQKRREGK